MRRTRTTEVIVETEELLVLSSRQAATIPAARGWCAACGAEVFLCAPEAAASAAGLTPRTIYHLLEAGRLHFSESTAGQLLVCLPSLVGGQHE